MTIDKSTRPVHFADFHGMTLLVVENGGKNYVEVKPLGDLLGMRWRTLRETVQSGDNPILYGTKRLMPAVFNVVRINVDSLTDVSGPPGGPQTPDTEVATGAHETENVPADGVLHMLLERVQMFLARINTSQMRVQGNNTGANHLLTLQIEWAQVLHRHVMREEVVTKSRKDHAALVANLMRTRALARPHEVAAFDSIVRDFMVQMGYPPALDPQQALAL